MCFKGKKRLIENVNVYTVYIFMKMGEIRS